MKRLLLTCAALAALSFPSSAAATDFYVDRDLGSDANDCSTPAAACQSVSFGVTFATNAGANNTVRVDDSGSPYDVSSVTLFSGVSVIADNTVAGTTTESPTGRPIIQTDAASSQAFSVDPGGSPGTTIRGFTFRPNDRIAINAPGTMNAIEDNVFEDPGASGNDRAIIVGLSSPDVSGNVFRNLHDGISIIAAGSAQITGNEFSGIHDGNAIEVGIGSPTITANHIHDPGVFASQAVLVGGAGATRTVSVNFRRNRIFGDIGFGVNVLDTAGPISFDGDLIGEATTAGIAHTDVDDNGDSAISATNVTIVSDGGAVGEIQSESSSLTLDSSILGAAGISDLNGATCSISFSRGPSTGAGCDNFQSTADPGFTSTNFADPGAFHLLASSPMVDAGNPAVPPGGTLDLDGGIRVIDGNCDGIARRDIGADELVANCLAPPTPPAVSQVTPTRRAVPPTQKKKCKKGRKLKKKKCVKKKRKKGKKKRRK